jgi:hypothetical protein
LDNEWHLIEKWMQKQMKDALTGVERGYFLSSFDFWWYDTNGQILQTAYSPAAIALGCASAVVLFSSKSIVLTIFFQKFANIDPLLHHHSSVDSFLHYLFDHGRLYWTLLRILDLVEAVWQLVVSSSWTYRVFPI